MQRLYPSSRAARLMLWFGAAALALGLFLAITGALLERQAGGIDRSILLTIARVRRPALTSFMVNVTALGSTTLVTLFAIIALVVVAARADWRGAVQLVLTILGAALLTHLTKHWIERPRPTVVPRLVQTAGFSYPSGHTLQSAALFFTLALLTAYHVRSPISRAAVMAWSVLLVLLIGLSRLYLGVHYPSDVAAGIFLGLAWSLFVGGVVDWSRSRPEFPR